MPPGWFLRLKPSFLQQSVTRPASVAVDGISYVLKATHEPHEKTQRFAQAYEQEFREYVKRSEAERRDLQKRVKPVLKGIKVHFPKFAGLIKRQLQSSDSLAPPATEEQLAETEQMLELKIPTAMRRLFESTQRVALDGLTIDAKLFIYPIATQLAGTPMICFGEYYLHADGDQVLFRAVELPDDDPLIYDYAHAIPAIQPTTKRFTPWLESLSRSSVFRD